MSKKIIIIGAGPAGLAAAYELVKSGQSVTVLEKNFIAGGISRTVEYKGYHFDIGGHRFFTKEEAVLKIWKEVLGDDFLTRPRLSRIFYNNKYYNYPLKPINALKNLGFLKSIIVFSSYVLIRIKHYLGLLKNPENFEEWVKQKFGTSLFNIFFKTYTEKVWGIPTNQIGADWAAQRIKGLSLSRAVINAFFPNKSKVTTLIDEFQYPRRGPGMMYGRMTEKIKKLGGKVVFNSEVIKLKRNDNKIFEVAYRVDSGQVLTLTGNYFISSMPLPELIRKIEPLPNPEVLAANSFLKFRSFITVCLIVDNPNLFSDTWLYIHSPEVKVGRIQNFKNWSLEMVPDQSKTALGMEYFCFEGDELWKSSEEDLIKLASQELEKIGLGKSSEIIDGFVVRQPDAYPTYKMGYREPLEKIYNHIKTIDNLQIIGRGGLFRYNNMDHSILTGLYAAKNILGGNFDVLNVNMEEAYLEMKR